MGWSLDSLRTLGFPPTGRGHLMVSLRRRMAGTAGLDFMGRRILCEKALAAEVVSCKLARYYLLLRSRACSGHSLTIDNFGFRVSHAELYNSYLYRLAGRCAADEDEQTIETTQPSAIPRRLSDFYFGLVTLLQTVKSRQSVLASSPCFFLIRLWDL